MQSYSTSKKFLWSQISNTIWKLDADDVLVFGDQIGSGQLCSNFTMPGLLVVEWPYSTLTYSQICTVPCAYINLCLSVINSSRVAFRHFSPLVLSSNSLEKAAADFDVIFEQGISYINTSFIQQIPMGLMIALKKQNGGNVLESNKVMS